MEDGSVRPWVPLVAAVVIGLLMIWLAGAPLESKPVAVGGALVEPTGDVDSFPGRFLWTPVDGADLYEITVGRVGGEALFRQRGTTTVLDLEFDEGAAPPPGRYVWEVRAFRLGKLLGAAQATFEVGERGD